MSNRSHNVVLENRKKMSVSGVEHVTSFNPDLIILVTVQGNMTIKGAELDIKKLNLDDGYIRYEIGKFKDDHHHHHHLICESCGKVIEVEDDLMGTIEERFLSNYNFTVTDHKVKFYGICENCK